jgi:hypothetical protein
MKMKLILITQQIKNEKPILGKLHLPCHTFCIPTLTKATCIPLCKKLYHWQTGHLPGPIYAIISLDAEIKIYLNN